MSVVLAVLEKYNLQFKLVKSGKEALLRCPFKLHNDKTPSLYVEVSTGYYHCFACKTGGKSIESFVEKLTGEKTDLSNLITPGEEFQFLVNQIYEQSEQSILAKSYNYYRNEEIRAMYTSFDDVTIHTNAMEYLMGHKRKLSRKTIMKYRLKFCGFGEYKNRIIIPYFRNSTLIGFNARLLGTDKEIGKDLRYRYVLNQNAFSDYIFNIEKASGDTCILVEGPFDLMYLEQCGYRNVISTLSTRISPEHFGNIAKFRRFIFVFDNDEKKSGEKAMMTAAKMMLNMLPDREIYACKLPDFKDPNECTPAELKASLGALKQIRLDIPEKKSELTIFVPN